MSIITADEARAWIKIPAGTDADAIIDVLVAAVSQNCATVVGGPVETTAFDRYLTGDDTSVLILPASPVISITSLSLDGGATLTEGWDQGYTLTKATGLVRLTAGFFASRPGSIHAVWSAGYATIPNDLKLSVMKAVAFDYYAQDKRRQGVTQSSNEFGGTTFTEEEYPRDVVNVWKRYRKLAIA